MMERSTKAAKDGTQKFRYVLENDGDKFRIWCWVIPQPEIPADSKDDKKDTRLQYRNRNIVYKSVKPGRVKDRLPLLTRVPCFIRQIQAAASTRQRLRRAVSGHLGIPDDNGLKRIKRHADWKTKSKGWGMVALSVRAPDSLQGPLKRCSSAEYLLALWCA